MTQMPGIPYESLDPQTVKDRNHLRLLAIFHYIWGGLVIAISSIFIIHIVLGILMLRGTIPLPKSEDGPPSEAFAWLFVGAGSAAVLIGWTLGFLMIYSGRCLAAGKNRTFSLVLAALSCLSIPLGTILGVFTIVVLVRPSVRMMYEGYRK